MKSYLRYVQNLLYLNKH